MNHSSPSEGLVHIEGYGAARPFRGARVERTDVSRTAVRFRKAEGGGASKVLPNLREAIRAAGLKSGDTISFHHHLRNGDAVLNIVIAEAAAMGLRDLTVAASSLFAVHAPLVDHIQRGIVSRIYTAYMTGPVADAISSGILRTPVVMQTHGGRARAIESGELHIDVAFIAAPAADDYGNLSGTQGRAACGPLGYAVVDAQYASCVIAVTDQLVAYPCGSIDITQEFVDFVVEVDSIGDPNGILSGTTRPTTDPVGLEIARQASSVIEASGYLVDDFSFQTGAGGVSLAVAAEVGKSMRRRGVRGSFAAGGVTGYLVDMLEQGLFRNLFDVQCFDLKAVQSYRDDSRHLAMSASMYANPNNRGAVANRLDAMILGAAEIDRNFNVNVTTGSSGNILGGSGGHADTAAGSKLSIVTTRLTARGGPKVVQKVRCITTPGETVDVVVTEFGIAVNPRRGELEHRLRGAGLMLKSIDTLCAEAARLAPVVPSAPADGRIVGVVEYRDGTVIDVLRMVA